MFMDAVNKPQGVFSSYLSWHLRQQGDFVDNN